MDYRSFYLHYENAVWMCDVPVIKAIKADFLETLEQCLEINPDQWYKRPMRTKILQGLARIFAIFF